MRKYRRITRAGGVIRLTEGEVGVESTSPAMTALNFLVVQALFRSGNLFTPTVDGVTSSLVRLLQEAGLQDVQTQAHALTLRARTSQGQNFIENTTLAHRGIVPFFQKWGLLPPDYGDLYNLALAEMRQPNFVAIWKLLTVWGENPH